MKTQIKNLSEKTFQEVKDIRRHLHMYPELSFEEKQTSLFIQKKLKANNIKFTKGWAGHGIVAKIGKGKRKVGLRADMDALPIQETNNIAYKSKYPGIMHACGHDVHSASLLGAAIILKQIEKELNGEVVLIFQPGEEKLPGGASIMIKEGLFKKHQINSMVGQHVHPPLGVGKVGFRPGIYMASADELFLKVNGKGGHAALPHKCKDTILIAAKILEAMQSIVSRNSNPLEPSVLTFGKINSVGGATNIIPDQVLMEGTFRTMNEKWRKEAHRLIKQIGTNTAKAMGGTCEVNIKIGYPCLKNDESLTSRMKSNAIEFLGKSKVVDLPKRMTAEDFSFYSHKVPSCFYRLGTGNVKKKISSPVHTSTFNIDEQALSVGSGLMAYHAYKELI